MSEQVQIVAGIRQLVMDIYREGLGLETSVEEKEAMNEVMEGINATLKHFAVASLAQSLGLELPAPPADDDDD